MRRETADLIGSGLLLAALLLATFGALAPAQGASASVSSAPVAVTSAAVERGRALFYAKGCVGCHTLAGETGAVGKVGPDLTGLFGRAGDRKPGMAPADYVRESLRSPSAFKVPGYDAATFGMPDLGLGDAEIEALTAFLLETTQ